MEQPQVWFMVKTAIENLTGELSYSDIKNYINSKWDAVNQLTINAQITVATVNHHSRTHYNENKKPRFTNTGSHFDLLYSLDRGKVVKYDPVKHGLWEIYINEHSKPQIKYNGTNAFLFAWNSKNWPFEDLDDKIKEIRENGKATVIWSIQSHKKIKVGDRAFIIRLGSELNGIFASGYVISEPALLPHWKNDGTLVYRVTIELDYLINPNNGDILDMSILKNHVSKTQHWSPQSSGIQIRQEVVYDLEKCWFNFLSKEIATDDRIQPELIIIEGTSYQLVQTVYERNKYARMLCLQHHGYSCVVCSFNFKDKYGNIGNEFIHVHHLNQLSITGGSHETNPINDLRPVCPNCHAMLHKRNPPYTIEELKGMID